MMSEKFQQTCLGGGITETSPWISSLPVDGVSKDDQLWRFIFI